MPSAYEGTDIISCGASRISYRISDISLKNEFHYGIIHLDKLEFGGERICDSNHRWQ